MGQRGDARPVRLHQAGTAPNLLVGGTRYRDSDGSRRNETRAAFEQPLGDVRLNLLLELVETSDDQKSSDARRVLLGGEARLSDWLTASAALGATAIRDDQTDGYAVGRLNAWGRHEDLGYGLRLAGNITRTRYSDDNDSTEAELTPQLVLRLRDPRSLPRAWRS